MRHLLPKSEPWKQYAEWARDYDSPIISYRIYNQRVIILNDSTTIHNLLSQRASIYSDRPKSWMFHEICARGDSVFNISSMGNRHRQYRRLLQVGLGPSALSQYWSVMEGEVDTLIQGMIHSPNDFEKHIRRSTAAVIMKVAYGYTVRENDPFIGVAEESAKISTMALTPGRWLVDYIPMLRYVPSWFPFASFKRQGEAWKRRLESLSDVPHQWVKNQMEMGTHEESFTSRLLRPDGKNYVSPDDEEMIKWCAGGLYAGACDTIVSALLSFIYLMALNPSVQATAQEELDEIFGANQRPQSAHLGNLRYLAAVLREVLRFAPVANIALPHKVTEEDMYAGYRIPKNSTIIPNVWAVLHDPALFPNPDRFDPARFLSVRGTDTTNPDPMTFAFGFGKRRCPAALTSTQRLQFAETSLLSHMAGILSRFNISARAPLPNIEFTTGITSHIKPFPIDISPRN